MWIDPNGVQHTIYLPAQAVLGEQAVGWARGLLADEAASLQDDLNQQYAGVYAAAEAAAKAEGLVGPADFDDLDDPNLPVPPQFADFQPQPGVPLAEAVMAFVNSIPAQWRVEVYEAFLEALDPETDDPDDVDDDVDDE